MPVNTTLSEYSDLSYVTAIAVYVLALVLHAAENAFGRRAVRRERRAELAAVGAGATAVTGEDTVEKDRPGRVAEPVGPSLPERLGRMGVAVTVLAVLLHLASLVLRGLATSRVPWGNMYEYISAVCLAAVVAWLVLLFRQARGDAPSGQLRQLGAFVLLPMVLLLFLAGTVLYTEAAPLVPALRSYWIVIHVSAAVIASGVFLVAGVASVLYLMRARYEAAGREGSGFVSRLPEAAALDRVAYRTTVFAFPMLTFGIIAGAIWAEAAWGRYWGWDPKETCSFIAWVVYAAYLHARATAGWRGNRAAWVNILGFAVTVFNLFFVNLVTAGLHSYSGLS